MKQRANGTLPDFARTEREPVVAVSEGGINLGQKGGL